MVIKTNCYTDISVTKKRAAFLQLLKLPNQNIFIIASRRCIPVWSPAAISIDTAIDARSTETISRVTFPFWGHLIYFISGVIPGFSFSLNSCGLSISLIFSTSISFLLSIFSIFAEDSAVISSCHFKLNLLNCLCYYSDNNNK